MGIVRTFSRKTEPPGLPVLTSRQPPEVTNTFKRSCKPLVVRAQSSKCYLLEVLQKMASWAYIRLCIHIYIYIYIHTYIIYTYIHIWMCTYCIVWFMCSLHWHYAVACCCMNTNDVWFVGFTFWRCFGEGLTRHFVRKAAIFWGRLPEMVDPCWPYNHWFLSVTQ